MYSHSIQSAFIFWGAKYRISEGFLSHFSAFCVQSRRIYVCNGQATPAEEEADSSRIEQASVALDGEMTLHFDRSHYTIHATVFERTGIHEDSREALGIRVQRCSTDGCPFEQLLRVTGRCDDE